MELFDMLYARTVQRLLLLERQVFPPPPQQVETGDGAVMSAGHILRERRRKKAFLIAGSDPDPVDCLTRSLEDADLSCFPCPTPSDGSDLSADSAAVLYAANGCDCIVAVGDSAVIDRAKAVSVIVGSGKIFSSLSGRKRLIRLRSCPTVLVIPTQTGSGSESHTTVCLTAENGTPLYLTAPALCPELVILDPSLIVGSDRAGIARAGLQGLCLALEAFLSTAGSREPVRTMASDALRNYFGSLEPCWNSGGTSEQRLRLLEASVNAGRAASFSGFGYIYAASCAAADTAHITSTDGLGVFLPAFLDAYGSAVTDSLAELATLCGIMEGGTRTARQTAFISRLRTLIFRLGLPDRLETVSPEQALPIADKTLSFANPGFSCPVYWTPEICRSTISSLCGSNSK